MAGQQGIPEQLSDGVENAPAQRAGLCRRVLDTVAQLFWNSLLSGHSQAAPLTPGESPYAAFARRVVVSPPKT